MILIISTYFNNPHFIKYQYKSFKKYLKEPFDFIILNDSKPTTKSIISGKLAKKEIQHECQKYNIKHILIPQNIHHHSRNSPGGRHQSNLNWYFSSQAIDKHAWGEHRTFDKPMWNNKNRFDKNLYDKYDYLLIIDADTFIKNTFSFEQIFNNNEYTFTGQFMRSHELNFIHIGFMGINLKNLEFEKISELNFYGTNNNINCKCGAKKHYIDSGGALHYFLSKYPEYKVKYISLGGHYLYDYTAGTDWNRRGNHKRRLGFLEDALQLED